MKIDLSITPKAIWKLTWPQMLIMYLFFFMNVTSIWAAGQISSKVQASIGMATQCSFFLMVLIMSISSGATAAISQSLGMGKIQRAKLYILTMVFGSFLLGIITAILALIFDKEILSILQIKEELMSMSLDIWHITIIGLPLHYTYFVTGAMFRSVRLVIPPMLVAAFLCFVSFFGTLGFGLGWFGFPDCGYLGIMWITVVTQAIGAIINCIFLRRSGFLSFNIIPNFTWLKKSLPYLFRVAIPAGAAQIVWQSGFMVIFVLVSSVPQDSVCALAGLTAGLRAESFIFMPAMALNMTASVFVGNSLGEGKKDQAKRIGIQLVGIGALAMSVIAALLWPFRHDIATLLALDINTQAQIVSYLTYNLISTPFSVASQIMGGIMTGAGATIYNLMIYGGTFWGVRIPLGWYLGHKLLGEASGVFIAMLVSQCIQSLIMLYVVLNRNWSRFAMKNRTQTK